MLQSLVNTSILRSADRPLCENTQSRAIWSPGQDSVLCLSGLSGNLANENNSKSAESVYSADCCTAANTGRAISDHVSDGDDFRPEHDRSEDTPYIWICTAHVSPCQSAPFAVLNSSHSTAWTLRPSQLYSSTAQSPSPNISVHETHPGKSFLASYMRFVLSTIRPRRQSNIPSQHQRGIRSSGLTNDETIKRRNEQIAPRRWRSAEGCHCKLSVMEAACGNRRGCCEGRADGQGRGLAASGEGMVKNSRAGRKGGRAGTKGPVGEASRAGEGKERKSERI